MVGLPTMWTVSSVKQGRCWTRERLDGSRWRARPWCRWWGGGAADSDSAGTDGQGWCRPSLDPLHLTVSATEEATGTPHPRARFLCSNPRARSRP